MPLHIVSSFLLRAPLLPVGAAAKLARHPLGREAIALASPELSAALERSPGKGRRTTEAAAALERYGRRAAFRATPHGLLAGVAMGRLGARTQLDTGLPRAHLTPSWARLAALGRSLLDEPAVRAGACLRVAPSLVVAGADAWWLALPGAGSGSGADEEARAGDARLEVRQADVDAALAAVMDAATRWTSWGAVRAAAAAAFDTGEEVPEDEEVDEYLLVLIDQDLLHHDLRPPLVGPPPVDWMERRLAQVPAPSPPVVASARESLATLAVSATSSAPSAGELARRLEDLPGGGPRELRAPFAQATLLHDCAVPATLSRAAVARAAGLAPLLFRLQQALTPPAAERALSRSLVERLEAMAETFGAGAFDVEALAAGGYGATLVELEEDPAASRSPEATLLSYLVEALTEAARDHRETLTLDPVALDVLLPPAEPPPSFELVLTPTARSPGRRGRAESPGAGWLLGLHAPAGASWGRFAHSLGEPMMQALAELAALEAEAWPGHQAVDVTFAASPSLADLCVHPPVRARALALVSWSERHQTDVRPADLELVLDAAGGEPMGLRARGGPSMRPSPLHRVRSTTVPEGIYRLLAGWSFMRQHAPWALSWGALANLPWLPRVVIDGFVVAPASWRIPAVPMGAAPEPKATGRSRQDGRRARGWLARWRRDAAVPRMVQVGAGDELLLVDLDSPEAVADLGRHQGGRAHEIWPPLGRLADRGGRRVEAVVAVVHRPEVATVAPGASAPAPAPTAIPFDDFIRSAGAVPPPGRRPAAAGWMTYKLFGAEDRQDQVLLAGVGPLVRAARAEAEVASWFFLRYVEGDAGRRDHLRLRVRAPSMAAQHAFTRRLEEALAPLRRAGDVVALETAEYFPETARYGGPATLADVERLFELDSDLVLGLLAAEAAALEPPEGDALDRLVRSWDALGRGLGLDLPARRALAARRRAAAQGEWPMIADRRRELDASFRRRQRRLTATLAGTVEDPFSSALDAHVTGVRALVAERSREARAAAVAVLAPILHLAAVRRLGARPADEAVAYLFWERALDSLAARRR